MNTCMDLYILQTLSWIYFSTKQTNPSQSQLLGEDWITRGIYHKSGRVLAGFYNTSFPIPHHPTLYSKSFNLSTVLLNIIKLKWQ